jgi:hypothetical protein
MKFSLVLAFFLLAALPGWSQVGKGTQAIGTTLAINRYKAVPKDNIESKYFSITPEYTFFFANNLSAIAGTSFGSSSRDRNAVNTLGEFLEFSQNSSNHFRTFAAVRKHIPIQDQLFLIGTVGLEYAYDNFKSDIIRTGRRNQRQTKTHEVAVFGNVGLIYFPTNRWSLELIVLTANLKRFRSNSIQDNRHTHNFTFWRFDLAGQMNSPHLGIRYYFLGNRK